ncbi:hypothetical protein LTR22_000936 [Elasticomyces elasticus]|nr:hypothetical protein LTR22_000936 [Elasticomyces elasticus]KAK4922742.1 hypothetical protein LTR49_009930 [Elasticomyces elasticus]
MATPNLLDLPPELRERVLKALLTDDAPVSLQHRLAEPEVSRVCRSLRDESLGVFFQESTFCIDNNGGHTVSMQKLSNTLQYMRTSDIASIRRLRLDWNTHCRGNEPYCFTIRTVPSDHSCHAMDTGWSAPVYLIACYITLTTQEPWAELSVSFFENALGSVTAQALHAKMSETLLQSLVGPLPAGQRRKRLTSSFLMTLAEVWQHIASRLLAQNCVVLQNQRMAAMPKFTNPSGHTLQDFQMQLMLLEQQNKKRLLLAREEQDKVPSLGLLSTYAK